MTVLDKETCSNGDWNFKMMVDTVNTLKYSQGFYSRLATALESMDECEIERMKEVLNEESKFNDQVDVILYLES